MPAFDNPALGARHDGARLTCGGVRLAFTTDSYVVRPLFFPGGDIGALAVNGTVNDLAMCGAQPAVPERRLHPRRRAPDGGRSARRRIDACGGARGGVTLVTGDTKVVDRGKGDGLYVNTAGIGIIEHDRSSRRRASGRAT